MEEHVASADVGGRYPVGNGEVIIRSRLGASPVVVPAYLASLLNQCSGFRTIDEHARTLSDKTGVSPGDLSLSLQELRRLRLLVTQVEVLAKLGAPTEQHAPGPPHLVITTSGRPELLRQNISTYREMNEPRTLIVSDDSTDPIVCRQNREIAIGEGAAYFGAEDRVRLASELADQANVDEALVRWAVGSPSIGGNRNGVLLRTAGSLIVSVDDDTTGTAVRTPGAVDRLLITAASDPTQFWFQSLPSPEGYDIVSAHGQVLGKSILSLLSESGFDFGDGGASVLASADGRVSATVAGLIGDSGMRSARYLLRLQGASRDRLVENLDEALMTRRMHRAPTQPTLNRGGWFMTVAVGLDNRETLPPFFPLGRNSDGLFGRMVGKVRHRDLVASLPVAVGHEPPSARSLSGDDALKWKLNPSELLISLLNRIQFPSGDSDSRLHWLGRYLEHLGRRPESEFQDEIWSVVSDTQSGVIAYLESLVDFYQGRPQDWADAIRKSIGLTREVMIATPIPEGMQSAVRKFGLLLQVWPDIWLAATERNPHQPRFE